MTSFAYPFLSRLGLSENGSSWPYTYSYTYSYSEFRAEIAV